MVKQKLSREEILHLAKLAKLQLTDKEIEKFQKQLSEVLDYISKLKEVDTKNVEPVSQVTGLVDVTREDEVDNTRQLSQLEATANAKDKKNGFIKVKAIFSQ